MGIKGWILGLAAVGAVGEYGIARYFFHRTVARENARCDRTWKIAGTDWGAYIPNIHANREWLAGQPQEEVYVVFRGGLRLHGMFFYCEGSGKAVVRFHGYTNEGLNDYTSIAKFCLSQDFSLMAVDERTHGKSKSTCVGLGYLDRSDAKQWAEYVVECLGEDYELMLHDISTGAATMLMPTDLSLPRQVRAAASDCVFTSAWEVFSHVLRSIYHMPAFPVMQVADRMIKSGAGYGLDGCNAREEVKKVHIPILSIHGDRDTFVPCSMVYELHGACASPRKLLVILGASHAEAYYKKADRYEHAIEGLIARFSGKKENKVRRRGETIRYTR